jgi:hypothetical protein
MTTLFPGQSLHPGQSLQSNNRLHTLIMQTDGNVVLYDSMSHPRWATNTGGLITPRELIMQPDGNLVLYSTDGKARWASLTWNNPGAFFNVQDDGNLVVYRAGSQTETGDNALWAAGSNDRPSGPAPSGRVQEVLAAHNNYRAEVGVPPLQWSDSLAASAQQWADHLASTGTFQHSGGGQNMSIATAGGLSVTQLVGLWGNEKQYFKYGVFPDVSTTGNFAQVGHYTQVIWRNTTEVGCGLATGNGNDILVCNYNPPGNFLGAKVY